MILTHKQIEQLKLLGFSDAEIDAVEHVLAEEPQDSPEHQIQLSHQQGSSAKGSGLSPYSPYLKL